MGVYVRVGYEYVGNNRTSRVKWKRVRAGVVRCQVRALVHRKGGGVCRGASAAVAEIPRACVV